MGSVFLIMLGSLLVYIGIGSDLLDYILRGQEGNKKGGDIEE